MGLDLEYVPNGTLEHWLRQYVVENKRRSKQEHSPNVNDDILNDISRRTLFNHAKNLSLDKSVFRGWKAPPSTNYQKSHLDLVDECTHIVKDVQDKCLKLEDGWRTATKLNEYADVLENFNEEKAKSFKTFVRTGEGAVKGIWEAFIIFEVNMRPDQWMASQMHIENHEDMVHCEWLEPRNKSGHLNDYKLITRMPLPFMRPRCTVYQGVGAYLGEGVYSNAVQTCAHEAIPNDPNFRRMTINNCGALFYPIRDDETNRIVGTRGERTRSEWRLEQTDGWIPLGITTNSVPPPFSSVRFDHCSCEVLVCQSSPAQSFQNRRTNNFREREWKGHCNHVVEVED